jgi:hypothetical protein
MGQQTQTAREQQKKVSDMVVQLIAKYQGIDRLQVNNYTPCGPLYRSIIFVMQRELNRDPVYDDDHRPSEKTTKAELVGMFTTPVPDSGTR